MTGAGWEPTGHWVVLLHCQRVVAASLFARGHRRRGAMFRLLGREGPLERSRVYHMWVDVAVVYGQFSSVRSVMKRNLSRKDAPFVGSQSISFWPAPTRDVTKKDRVRSSPLEWGKLSRRNAPKQQQQSIDLSSREDERGSRFQNVSPGSTTVSSANRAA